MRYEYKQGTISQKVGQLMAKSMMVEECLSYPQPSTWLTQGAPVDEQYDVDIRGAGNAHHIPTLSYLKAGQHTCWVGPRAMPPSIK